MKACAHCNTPFTPQRMGQKVCSPRCAGRYVKATKKAEIATTRARKVADLTARDLEQKLQPIFNLFIRLRDRDQPCISCGVMDPPMTSGGQWDAGHFKGVGAFPELRFDEDNCHKQCKKCNGGSGKFAHKARTVSQQYEVNILERIGQEKLDRLNGPHPTAKRTREWLLERIDYYRAKVRELKKETA